MMKMKMVNFLVSLITQNVQYVNSSGQRNVQYKNRLLLCIKTDDSTEQEGEDVIWLGPTSKASRHHTQRLKSYKGRNQKQI